MEGWGNGARASRPPIPPGKGGGRPRRGIATVVRGRLLRFRKELLIVLYALRHRGTPWRARLLGAAFLLYLLSPVDLVPVFIPVLGIVDDLLIVPWGLSLVVAGLPERVRAETEAAADQFIHRWVRRPLLFLAGLLALLAVLWALLLWLFFRLVL